MAFQQQVFHSKTSIPFEQLSVIYSDATNLNLLTQIGWSWSKHLELVEPEGIDGIDDIEKEVTAQAHKNQRLSRKPVRVE